MLSPTYPILTERLLLRPFAPADLDALVDTQTSPSSSAPDQSGPMVGSAQHGM